jgi:ribonuclease HI
MWVDGGARGNPGPAAVGYRIEDEAGAVLDESGRAIGVATNNEAEYRALITALERAAALGATEVEVRSDSELLMRQMTGRYRVKSPHLRALWDEAQQAADRFERVRYVEVRRADNTDADRQVNLALDRTQVP